MQFLHPSVSSFRQGVQLQNRLGQQLHNPVSRSLRLPLDCKLHAHGTGPKHNNDGSGSRSSATRATAVPASDSRFEGPTVALMNEPLSPMDVDHELWAVLDMCTDDELEAVYNILHSTSPFSPLLKSLLVERDEPALVAQRGRRSVMHKVESHFRFLAASSAHLLRGSRPSYREVLLNVREKLDVHCSRNLSTFDLETEIFLHLLAHCEEYVRGPETEAAGVAVDPSAAASFANLSVTAADVASPQAAAANATAAATTASRDPSADSQASAGAAGAETAAHHHGRGSGSQQQQQAGSGTGSGSGSASPPPPNWTERVTAPFRLGGLRELAPTLLNLAGAVTVTKVGQQATQQLATNLVCSHLRYQAALRAATAGLEGLAAKGVVAGWGKQAMLEAAQRSLTAATARYSALRGALSFLGPLMWGWLAVDLALKAIGPDHARVVRAVFLLAQVRLVRTHGFVSAEMEALRQDPASAFAGPGGGHYGQGSDGDDSDDYLDPGAAYM